MEESLLCLVGISQCTEINAAQTVGHLVTWFEIFGDCEMLNRFDGCISKGIDENKLDNLKENIPLILNLDDLELFWRFSNSEMAADQFIEHVNEWRKMGEEKGRCHFSFSYFLSEAHDQADEKNSFDDFFKWSRFIDQLRTT